MAFSNPSSSLIEDLGAVFRPQRQWAQGRGLLLITAHFLSGVGAGAWAVAAVLGFQPGLFVGLVAVLLGGIAHLAFLGRPDRFYRIITRVQSSWISRGLAGISIFTVFAVLYLILISTSGRDGLWQQVTLYLSLLGAVWIAVYKGFVWASSRGIPFWNSALLPAVFFIYAFRGGVATLFVSLFFASQSAGVALPEVELIKLWLGVSSAALVLVYLLIMPSTGIAAGRSVSELVGGRLSLVFYIGAVFLGLVVPIGIGAFGYSTNLSLPLLAIVGVSSLVGDFYTIFCIARAGIYRPLLLEFAGRPLT
ncbi:MAG: DmsC/YnfH family molybdoenzyme membrane anchor subunit [Dehalococcoidia bacterium]|nr:DmsC/YnfH family molybdoenzyme membrane anchor subunit [Dehalococcoidia bacterium]